MPPLRVGVGSDPSIFLPMAPGIAGQEVSPPLMGMTMQRSPLMVIMRFWSHWVMVTALPPRPPKLMSRRSRAPLMYTVLSLLLPIMVVRGLIFTSAGYYHPCCSFISPHWWWGCFSFAGAGGEGKKPQKKKKKGKGGEKKRGK